MKNESKLKIVQSLIVETMHEKSQVSFVVKSTGLTIVFNDNYAIKQVCAVLEPLNTMFINYYIDYDKELSKIVCIVY